MTDKVVIFEGFEPSKIVEAHQPTSSDDDLLYDAWAVIANVSGGDWSKQLPEWQAAAERWRDRWHETLPGGEHALVEA